jgi:hypothetical protein
MSTSGYETDGIQHFQAVSVMPSLEEARPFVSCRDLQMPNLISAQEPSEMVTSHI